jgi:uncharacterized protein (DUF2461 family)
LFYWRHYSDKEITAPDFVSKLMQDSKLLKPFLDFLNLTFFDKEPF